MGACLLSIVLYVILLCDVFTFKIANFKYNIAKSVFIVSLTFASVLAIIFMTSLGSHYVAVSRDSFEAYYRASKYLDINRLGTNG